MNIVPHLFMIASLAGLVAASGCAEPDKRVSAFTGDGAFDRDLLVAREA